MKKTAAEPEIEQQPEVLPDDIKDAIDRVGKDDQDGLIQPEAVVEAASDPESPLHRYFDWDDQTAAHAHRLTQARALIARYTVVRVDEGPKYVNVTVRRGGPDARRGYVPVERAIADADLYDQIVNEAERAIVSWRNRLSAFEKASGAVNALDKAVQQMKVSKTTGKSAA